MHAFNSFKVFHNWGFPLKMLNLEMLNSSAKNIMSLAENLASVQSFIPLKLSTSPMPRTSHLELTHLCVSFSRLAFFSFWKPFRCFSFILMPMLSFYSAFENTSHEFLSHTELILGCKNLNLTPWNWKIFHATSPSCQVNIISGLFCAFLNKWNKTCTSPCLLPKLGVCGLCFKHFINFFNV